MATVDNTPNQTQQHRRIEDSWHRPKQVDFRTYDRWSMIHTSEESMNRAFAHIVFAFEHVSAAHGTVRDSLESAMRLLSHASIHATAALDDLVYEAEEPEDA